MAKAKSSRKYN
uniref:Uncharacterized protein n=1 Tax=Anguilla anguilla TaxID=7936 RepID=A0A0E9UHW9_ANGAN